MAEQLNTQKKMHDMVRELLAKFCDECGKKYDGEDIRIVQSNRANIIVHLSCKHCGKTHMANIAQNMGISNRSPIKTDLRPKEVNKFAGKAAVSTDDVLDVYEWTKKVKDGRGTAAIKEVL